VFVMILFDYSNLNDNAVRFSFIFAKRFLNLCLGSFISNLLRHVREGVSTDSLKFRPAMTSPYTPCGQATPQTALQPFGGVARCAERATCSRLLPPWIPPSHTGLLNR
jgi:hypothetical protein